MSLEFHYDESADRLTFDGTDYSLRDPKAFQLLSRAWLRSGWDTKYVYGFSWLGRPIIQLPEDLVRIQEVIYQLKPDVIIETGVAHGGSLVFYASLCNAIGKGRVVGIDIEIRPHNRREIEGHNLYDYITLFEGSSIGSDIFDKVKKNVANDNVILVLLDSNHSKSHVLSELQLYSKLVSKGSYIVACDGIMKSVEGAPRAEPDWVWNNPLSAIDEFLSANSDFICEEPAWPFNEGSISERITYWPNAFLKKIA